MIKNYIALAFENILDLIYPSKCMCCAEIIPIPVSRCVCEKCADKLELLKEPLCKKCGRTVKSGLEEVCGECVGHDYAFVKNRAVFAYDGEIPHLIYKFKYGLKTEYGAGLGKLMAENFDRFFSENIDFIIPAPLHKARLKERGFNQAMLLAQEISKATGIPILNNAIIRVKNTVPMSGLGVKDREKNAQDAFKIKDGVDFSGKNLMIVDDIFTTGVTMNTCAKICVDHGAENVFCYTLSLA